MEEDQTRDMAGPADSAHNTGPGDPGPGADSSSAWVPGAGHGYAPADPAPPADPGAWTPPTGPGAWTPSPSPGTGGYGGATGEHGSAAGGHGDAAGTGTPGGDPGPAWSGQSSPGYSTPGYTTPGYSTPGYSTPGYSTPGHAIPGQVLPDQPAFGQPPPRHPRPRTRGLLTHIATAVVAAAVAVGLTLAFDPPGTTVALSVPGSNAVPRPAQAAPGSVTTSANRQAAITKVESGLVIINTQLTYNSEAAAGTGMVINRNGLVLTNNHVIRGATKISATVAVTGKTYPARVIGYDKVHDVGLIQLEGAPVLRTVPIGNSASVRNNDPVVAMGNAQGQQAITVAGGRITGLGKTITASDSGAATTETLHGMLETNAHILPGDSGGPLVAATGGVIGMDTAGNSNSVTFGQQSASQTGFAIPINTALGIARQIAGGHASSAITVGYPPFVGVFIAPGSSSNPRQQAAGLNGGQGNSGSPFPGFPGIPGFGGSSGNTGSAAPTTPHCSASQASLSVPSKIAPVNHGTLVEGTICGSPADTAGLTSGSVITAVDGQSVGAPKTLGAALAKYHPGDTVSLTWVSPSGQHNTSNVHLEAGPPQ